MSLFSVTEPSLERRPSSAVEVLQGLNRSPLQQPRTINIINIKPASEGDKTSVPAQLEIWAGVHKYTLSVNSGSIQSEAELEWLAHELSDWLGMEISVYS